MHSVKEIFLRGKTGRLAAKVWGPDSGTPVLALHGWLDNAASFDRLAPLLPGARIVALDLPGHGHSDSRPPGMPYLFVDWIPEVWKAAQDLGWTSFHLLGHSMGGSIALMFAGAYPERVSKVAVLEALGPASSPAEEVAERLRTYITESESLAGKKLPVHADLERAIAARLKLGGLTEAAARQLCLRGTREVPGGLTWRSDPPLRLTSPLRFTEEQVQTFLRRVSAPVLLIRAMEGLTMPPELADARRGCLKDTRLFTCPGSHHVHLNDPEAVAPVLRAFLSASA